MLKGSMAALLLKVKELLLRLKDFRKGQGRLEGVAKEDFDTDQVYQINKLNYSQHRAQVEREQKTNLRIYRDRQGVLQGDDTLNRTSEEQKHRSGNTGKDLKIQKGKIFLFPNAPSILTST